MQSIYKLGAMVALVLALPGSAAAATAVATTDVNIRSGPGPQFSVVGAISQNTRVELAGCLADSNWCQVNDQGTIGWSYGEYLATEVAGDTVVIAVARQEIDIPTVTYEEMGSAVATAREPAGAVISPPRDAEAQFAVEPPSDIDTYVVEHRREPVYLEGEVVVGAGLPETVEVHPIPDYEYHYTYVNEVPVLVQPETRRIVYIYR
jgi:uncharacterized protein YraI